MALRPSEYRRFQSNPRWPFAVATELDADQQAKLQKLLDKDYEVITADDRLLKIAQDFVEHCAARWEARKAMLVCIDKVTCARMLAIVQPLWLIKAAAVRRATVDKQAEIDAAADADVRQPLHAQRDRLLAQAQWLDETILSLIVSEGQGEVADFNEWGFDIMAHRALMKQGFETPDGKRVNVESAYKDPKHPFRVAKSGWRRWTMRFWRPRPCCVCGASSPTG